MKIDEKIQTTKTSKKPDFNLKKIKFDRNWDGVEDFYKDFCDFKINDLGVDEQLEADNFNEKLDMLVEGMNNLVLVLAEGMNFDDDDEEEEENLGFLKLY